MRLRPITPVDSLLMDVRHGLRMLTRNAGFTVAAVLALGLWRAGQPPARTFLPLRPATDGAR